MPHDSADLTRGDAAPSRREIIAGVAGLAGLAALTGCASAHRPLPPVTRTSHSYDRVKPRQDYPEPSVAQPPVPGWNGASVKRTAWTRSTPNVAGANRMGRITRITVHHDGMDPFYSSSSRDAMERIETIRRSHVNRGWADIGYHYVIDPAGRVYEGRPTNLQGAHVGDMNEQNLGVLMLGNFNAQQPTQQSSSELERFLATQMQRFRISTSRVYTHQELRPTECPGVSLQAFMNQTRSRGVLARA